MPKALDKETVKDIIRLHKRGRLNKDIAKVYGVGLRTVTKYLQETKANEKIKRKRSASGYTGRTTNTGNSLIDAYDSNGTNTNNS